MEMMHSGEDALLREQMRNHEQTFPSEIMQEMRMPCNSDWLRDSLPSLGTREHSSRDDFTCSAAQVRTRGGAAL